MFTLNTTDRHAIAVEPLIFQAHQSGEVRVQGSTTHTLSAFMGTGGNNTPLMVEPANGGGLMNCLPAELYHHGTVTNQDTNSGHLILSTVKPASPDTPKAL
jgi:hypothetical protein